jgi:X-Pro dipeptidyl-peptidase
VPVYSYQNAVRESVWVQTSLDNDGDGVPDKVAVDIVRPRAQVKVPVILEGSPYYACCGRGNESELKEYDANGVITKQPLFYDNYFVPRGYAFVAADLAGTNRSTGCEDVGGCEEVLRPRRSSIGSTAAPARSASTARRPSTTGRPARASASGCPESGRWRCAYA